MPDPAPDFYRETQLDGPDGRRLYAFFSGDVGCLVYVDGVGGTAFHSHDPAYAGDASAVIEHFREDGFNDGFPPRGPCPPSRSSARSRISASAANRPGSCSGAAATTNAQAIEDSGHSPRRRRKPRSMARSL